MTLSPTELRKLLSYDPETGRLYWLPRPTEMFHPIKQSQEAAANAWNAKFAGKEAFTAESHGYRCGNILGRLYRAHRVAWAIAYGEWPDEVDHISGIRNDNRLCNLRSVSHAENCRNMAMNSRNKSGHNGVYWDRARSKWVAEVCGKYIGRFQSLQDAVSAQKRAANQNGFHHNHGRAA